MAVFPVLYFFTFLYYTDAGSTMFVLLAYLLELKGHHVLGAMAGACAVMFRQTNVIWVVFIATSSACDELLEIIVPNKRSDLVRTDDAGLTRAVLKWFYNCVRVDRQALVRVVIVVMRTVWPYLIVALGFVLFVWVNGSIVVGAKLDHGAGFHVPLLFYFLGFTVAFSFVNFITIETVCCFIRFVKRRFLTVLFAVLIAFIAVHWFTYAHRYLVADNRHYTFYVWSRILARSPAARYLLVPAYLFSAYAVLHTLAARKHFLWRLVFVFRPHSLSFAISSFHT
jgi:alpha-1,2-glucosyltransferase